MRRSDVGRELTSPARGYQIHASPLMRHERNSLSLRKAGRGYARDRSRLLRKRCVHVVTHKGRGGAHSRRSVHGIARSRGELPRQQCGRSVTTVDARLMHLMQHRAAARDAST